MPKYETKPIHERTPGFNKSRHNTTLSQYLPRPRHLQTRIKLTMHPSSSRNQPRPKVTLDPHTQHILNTNQESQQYPLCRIVTQHHHSTHDIFVESWFDQNEERKGGCRHLFQIGFRVCVVRYENGVYGLLTERNVGIKFWRYHRFQWKHEGLILSNLFKHYYLSLSKCNLYKD